MVQFYVNQIRLNKMKIYDVPERWREEVRQILEEMD